MRALVRAYLAGHPVQALGLIVSRWVLWFAAGHPLGTVVGLTALVAGWGLIPAAMSAALIDQAAFVGGAVWADGPTRRYWAWTQGARFRRRWPSAFTEAYVQPEFDRAAVFPGNYYSAPDGLRPVLVAPRLSLLPRRVGRHDMRWVVRPWSAQGFEAIVAQSDRLARFDDRVVRTDLDRRETGHRRRWDLTVSFAAPTTEPDGDLPTTADGQSPLIGGDGQDLIMPPDRRGRRTATTNGNSTNGDLTTVPSIEPGRANNPQD